MRNKSIILVCCLILFGISAGAQAQTTKIMAYNTGVAWSDSAVFLQGGLIPIGTDFLAIITNRESMSDPVSYSPENQILYILDIKKKVLAMKMDVADQGFYWVSPSAVSSSFVLSYWNGTDNYISLYSFNKKSRTWSTMADTTQKVTTGYATAPSTPILPGYFVNTVRRDDTLWLDVYKY
jgi:hypothetical protein